MERYFKPTHSKTFRIKIKMQIKRWNFPQVLTEPLALI